MGGGARTKERRYESKLSREIVNGSSVEGSMGGRLRLDDEVSWRRQKGFLSGGGEGYNISLS